MIEPIGVETQSVLTSLGTMVYYTPTKSPWYSETEQNAEELPTLIFLHGFGGGSSAYEWSQVYPAFASDYRVLAADLIGWGRSQHPQRNYTPEDYISTIIEFIDNTVNSPSESVAVVASSLTAALTIRAAIERPELFKCLILTTPAGLSDFGEDYTRSIFAQIVKTPILDKFIYSAGVATSGGILNFLQTRQFARPERIYPEIVEAYLKSAQQPNAEYAALSFVRGDLCFDLSRYITQLKTPTAMIWGQKSQFTGPEIGKRLAALNPEAVKIFQELEDVGLTPQLELPGVTIGLIRKFLKLLMSH
ncbi:alpha/beta fold hydrolase [Gloeothece verrucosa]|uniref:Alpha/beta hydrolase fold protein n=1 Tax=Gloeothece verrucosa (strain PCC 7822) TaxID=497965 RepID=E0UDT3_GLOV7|nr:alpha/beta hydrolase [Gloeothece verrucosa]ADN16518.1 alpha/beta hydrolase fold protein [Gloeothece verrucosa PCC 7822]